MHRILPDPPATSEPGFPARSLGGSVAALSQTSFDELDRELAKPVSRRRHRRSRTRDAIVVGCDVQRYDGVVFQVDAIDRHIGRVSLSHGHSHKGVDLEMLDINYSPVGTVAA